MGSDRQESLEEYEKDYLQRLEKESNPPPESKQESGIQNLLDLQDILLAFTKETKELEEKNYIGQCISCKQNVSREEMKYDNGRIFHPECFKKFGSEFTNIDQSLDHRRRQAKIELVRLKNLKVRRNVNKSTTKKPTKKKKTFKKSTKRKTLRKTKARRKVAKRNTRRTKKKPKRRH